MTTTSETLSFAAPGNSGLTLATTTLNLASITSFSVGSAAFGTFTASTVMEILPTSAFVRSFYILGTFVSGTNFGSPAATAPASFTVSFTQTGGPNTAISDSSTLSVPPAFVPEPASVAMLGMGLVGAAGYTARRRRTR